jgi:hypothetical protein
MLGGIFAANRTCCVNSLIRLPVVGVRLLSMANHHSDVYRSLEGGITKRLFRFLDKRFYLRKRWLRFDFLTLTQPDSARFFGWLARANTRTLSLSVVAIASIAFLVQVKAYASPTLVLLAFNWDA